MRRSIVWDVLGAVLVSLYGTEVCPILESHGTPPMVPTALVPFLLSTFAVAALTPRVLVGSFETQTQRAYFLNLGRFVLVGALLALWDHQTLHVPFDNGFKVLLSATLLGHFAGVDLSLAHEHRLLSSAIGESTASTKIPETRSLVRRLSLFAMITVVLGVSATGFMILRDLDVLSNDSSRDVRSAVITELGALGVVVVLLGLNLVNSFARNVALLFSHQTRVLGDVARGELGQKVPVVTRDEFGVIAAHTNRMIEGLRERQKIKEALGKVVSPDVARELLEGKNGLSLGGSKRTLTVLFSDIRGFTAWSEGTTAEELVADLNTYFTEMVRIVHEEGGVVDKFIGDGMMAVFGLGKSENSSAAAARAARRMTQCVKTLDCARPLKIGVGIHRGEVIAGNIGSPDRMEYTFIGDSVNTAARLEALSSKLGVCGVVSQTLFDDLPPDEQAHWQAGGAHELKGKSAPVTVHVLITEGPMESAAPPDA